MKITTKRHNGWTIKVKEDRAGTNARKHNHGANTIIGDVPGTLYIGQVRGVYNAAGCGACIHFPTCPKGVKATTDNCGWRPNRFQSKKRLSNVGL